MYLFDQEAYQAADQTIIKNIPVRIIDYPHLIRSKIGAHRPKNLHDVAELDKIRQVVKSKNRKSDQ